MGYVLYTIGVVALALLAGWAVYVLPTPGELSPWQLTGAMVPAVGIILAAFGTVWLVQVLVGMALRAVEFFARRRP